MGQLENYPELWTPQGRGNPLPLYARMRQEASAVQVIEPVQRIPVWVVPRYKDAVELLRDGRFVKDSRKLTEEQRKAVGQVDALEALNRHMLASDPPDHTRLRSLVAKAFTPKRIEGLRPRIQAIASGLLEAAMREDRVDLISTFAFPLPMTVIAELLGIPVEDQDQFREWTSAMLHPKPGSGVEEVMQAGMMFLQYLQELLEKRRAEPRDDLITGLLQAEEQGDRLGPEELMGMVFLLLVAGHETTVNLIGNGTWALLKHPEQRERLRENPELVGSAVEEMLRYCGPLESTTGRFVVEAVDFHGVRIAAGQMVLVSVLSADHDPEQFPEPDRFDIGREPNRHIAFGSGIHFCLGAPLARLEAQVAFSLLMERAPKLRLAVDEAELRWTEGMLVRGLKRLPVAWT